jgi:Ser/Thr protein kinase RdoA (MazF antagonist)
MPLFDTLPVNRAEVAAAVSAGWGLTLDDVIKASQNHTYAAHAEGSRKYAVRATPDPKREHEARISDEVSFVRFLAESGLTGVCAPVSSHSGEFVVRTGDVIICVVDWAEGAMLDFMAFKWMTDESIVRAWGAWLASLHAASRAFAAAHPETAARIQSWDRVHERIMEGAPLHAEDAAAAAGGPSAHFGVLHGDCNVSNFFVHGSPPQLSVFDWDQAQLGWWEYDLAQSALAAFMLAEGGSLPAGDPVPEANPAQFLKWLVAGYESVAGAGAIDLGRLDRMVALRKTFYGRFAERALKEGAPPSMEWFLQYVQRWLGKAAAAPASSIDSAARPAESTSADAALAPA